MRLFEKQSYRPSRQSGHFGNTTINSVNGADIANTVEVMYGVDCDIKTSMRLFENKVIDQVVSGHFGNTTINSVNGADIANTVEVMYGVDCDIKTSMRLFENKVIDQVVKVVILAIQQSTPLMVLILPTQLRSCMVSIAI
jgi:fructose-specific phosphotransferase system component IIB